LAPQGRLRRLVLLVIAAISEALNYDRVFSVPSTAAEFLLSFCPQHPLVAACPRFVFGEALNYLPENRPMSTASPPPHLLPTATSAAKAANRLRDGTQAMDGESWWVIHGSNM
jgi:hypothetical protein